MRKIAIIVLILVCYILSQPNKQVLKEIVFKGCKHLSGRELKNIMLQKESSFLQTEYFNESFVMPDSLSIISKYHDIGCLNVSIDSIKFMVDDTVKCLTEIISITENERYIVKKIEFFGNKNLSSKSLKQAMEQKESFLFLKEGYNPYQSSIDSVSLLMLYQNRGFLDASIDSIRFYYENDTTSKIESVYVTENGCYVVDSISITGNDFFEMPVLFNMLEIKKGDFFDREKVKNSQLSISQMFTNQGYLDAELEMDYTKLPGNFLDLKFIVKENARLKIDSIQVKGNIKTKSSIIQKAFPVKSGEWIYYDKIIRGQKRLYETGIFSSIAIQLEPSKSDSSKRVIIVKVIERKAGALEFGGGYGTLDGWRASSGISAGNLRGNASNISFQLKGSLNETKIGTTYQYPWILSSQFNGNLGLGATFLKENDNWIIEAGTGADRPVGDFSNFGLSYRFQLGSLDTTSENSYNGAILPVFTSDTRNDIFNTKKGRFSQIGLEYAAPYTLSEFNYFKVTLENRGFYSPNSGRTYALRTRIGLVNKITSVPDSSLYHVGGDQSLRGYGQDINNTSSGNAAEGIINMELRQKIYSGFGAAIFIDGAALSEKNSFTDYFGNFWGAGIGLRYSFSIGVIRIDWANRIDSPWTYKNNSYWYFALGQAF